VAPATFQGKCVRKSDENAAHDGAIITCPIAEREQGVVYHKLINNRCDEEYVEDIRVPVIGNTIPHVYLKYKPVDQRFANFRETPDDKLPQIHPPEEVLSGSEIKAIKEMARRMHLEFGEMDVLRDRDDGRVYVVDVNNTPTGPSHLKKKDMDIAINRLAQTFKREFLQ
jgi:glutathione synthase/RimK-type ligase-like ATP-grasp enzyme